MKCLLIDDESSSRKVLRRLCQEYCPDLEIVGEADSVNEGIKKIDTLKPDLVFLDIHMPVKSGFALLEHYQDNIDFSVIFTTAYNEYAIEAFRYTVVDYLQKPIDIDELQVAVAKSLKNQRIEADQIRTLQEALFAEKIQKIALTTAEGYTFVRFEDIIRCEAQGNYTNVYLNNGDTVLITKTLKHYDELLLSKGFFRVHKSHLINLNFVRKFLKGKKSMVEMTDGIQIEVSSRKREELLEKLSNIK